MSLKKGTLKRLKWLRTALVYTGSLHLKDFMAVFSIATSQASRDKQAMEDELHALTGTKVRFGQNGVLVGESILYPSDDMLPLRDVLPDLLGNRYVKVQSQLRADPGPDILRPLIRSIKEQRVLRIAYMSANGTSKNRRILPHSLVDADGRLHVRARDEDGKYKDFVLNRMRNPIVEGKHAVTPHLDEEWATHDEIVLFVSDPDNKSAHTIMREYGIDSLIKERSIKERRALLTYALATYDGLIIQDEDQPDVSDTGRKHPRRRFAGRYPISLKIKRKS